MKNLKLVELNEKLLDELIAKTGIAAKDVDYDKDFQQITFWQLDGIDTKKAYEAYMSDSQYGPFAKIQNDFPIFGM